jgi:hypothetical protein
MRVLGGMILFSTVLNMVLAVQDVSVWGHDVYSQWYFDWSPIFIFVGLLMVLASFWQDPRIVLVVAGILAILWYVFIVLGRSL